MAYPLDLSTISLERFQEILTTFELLPSRKVLADHMAEVVARLGAEDVTDLDALRKLLADKKRYPELAERLGVDGDYLIILNREVNAYKTKALTLARLEVFSDEELTALAGAGITSTKHLYERCCLKAERENLVSDLGIDLARLENALKMANLIRVNGAGPSFARFFIEIGLTRPEDFRDIDPVEIADRYNASIADDPSQPKLRHEDIDYCKRFSEGLQTDIEW